MIQTFRAASLFFAFVLWIWAVTTAHGQNFTPQETDRASLLAAIAAEAPDFPVPAGVTGMTVPHHLLAANLIARGFWAASSSMPKRIVLIAPDHFHLVPEGFAVAPDMATESILGNVTIGRATMERLAKAPMVRRHPNIAQEHGITAILPFIAHFFPMAEVVAVVASTRGGQSAWDSFLPYLIDTTDAETLVIQSTDFSHFLPIGEAVLRDQQTLDVLATGDADNVLHLTQPGHLDSPAAMYLQMRLQAELAATSAVIGNRNSVDYGGNQDETTSYITLVWHRMSDALSSLDYTDQRRVFLGGDTLLGRGFSTHLERPDVMAKLMNAVLALTRGAPLVLNLEGVLAPSDVANAGEDVHLMTRARAETTLRGLNVVGAGLANNHSWDFGQAGRDLSVKSLQDLGIAPLEHGQSIEVAGVHLVGINLLQGRDPFVAREGLEKMLCALDVRTPVLGLVHWGQEYTDRATPLEHDLADAARRCGFVGLVGAHSHQASETIVLSPSGLPFLFSLGNFMFDQNADRSSGALVEIRRFDQGTVAMRRIGLPHLFQLGFDVSD